MLVERTQSATPATARITTSTQRRRTASMPACGAGITSRTSAAEDQRDGDPLHAESPLAPGDDREADRRDDQHQQVERAADRRRVAPALRLGRLRRYVVDRRVDVGSRVGLAQLHVSLHRSSVPSPPRSPRRWPAASPGSSARRRPGWARPSPRPRPPRQPRRRRSSRRPARRRRRARRHPA